MKLSERDKRFVEENLPVPYNTPDKFDEFIRPKIQIHDALCTATKASVKKLIAPLLQEYKHRFFCRIDDSHQQKSFSSIIGKIRRSQEKNGEPEHYDLSNFTSKMTDLARFRVVCNFTSDTDLPGNNNRGHGHGCQLP